MISQLVIAYAEGDDEAAYKLIKEVFFNLEMAVGVTILNGIIRGLDYSKLYIDVDTLS